MLGRIISLRRPRGRALVAWRVRRVKPSTPVAALAALAAFVVGAPQVSAADESVLSIFESRCRACHNKSFKLGDLALDSADGLSQGGAGGAVVAPGNALESRLFRRVAHLEEPYMPMQGERLSDAEIAVLKEWIESGAVWPSADASERAATVPSPRTDGEPESPSARLFREQIHPILVRCQACHDEALKYAALSLETAEGLRYGGLRGRAVIPGDADASLLYRKAARLEPHFMLSSAVMLTDDEIAAVREWIEGGAVWPDPAAEQRRQERAEQLARLKPFEDKPIKPQDREWWAFQKPQRPDVPTVSRSSQPTNPIDAFVLRAKQAKGLDDAPAADPQTLLRRVFLDVTGLPPTLEQQDLFLADPSPEAYEDLVDRLLSSPHYGERWGRHWLDVARYADSDGYEYDKLRPNAWRYRDYVIRSFNQDKPYDRFIVEQLAGDELPDRNTDSIIALGFLRNGPFIGDMAFQQNEDTRQDELDDIVSTTASAFLGLTVGCARCHDHKYDPILQRDYYRMVAVFAPAGRKDVPLLPPDKAQQYHETMARIDQRVEALKFELYTLKDPARKELLKVKYESLPEPLRTAILTPPEERTDVQERQAKEVSATVQIQDAELMEEVAPEVRERIESLNDEVQAAEESRPSAPMAQAVADMSPQPRETFFLHRGNIRNKGSAMEPGALEILLRPGEKLAFPKDGLNGKSSGRRLTLAKWIANPDNPLTARVAVNRIWQHYFGRGIVGTPSNFGITGEAPTHPELLDWLATELVRHDWSLKAIHRLILTSEVYRQSSTFRSEFNQRIDPDNRLLWRMPLRRLEGEVIRDSILFASGGLNGESGGPPVFPELDPGIVESSPKGGDYKRWPETEDGPTVWKRSIYVAQMRTITPPILDLSDPPDKSASCPERPVTTVPTQALQLLNNPFISRQAALLADRLVEETGHGTRRQVERAFLLALSRAPSDSELDQALSFLAKQQTYHEQHNAELRSQGVDPFKISTPERAALIDLCLGLYNLNEFVYVN